MANALHLYYGAKNTTGNSAATGAHELMNWNGTLFTDSGGYQVFSLKDDSRLSDKGVYFELTGTLHTSAQVIHIQKRLGSDIMLVLDDCAPYPCSRSRVKESVRRTSLWALEAMRAHRSLGAFHEHDQELWGILQGGVYRDLRKRSIEEIAGLDFPGYAIGGLSIGMSQSITREMTSLTCESLPAEKPRHLLGAGRPDQIVEAVEDGVDSFDCVLPVRKGQRGLAYTRFGELRYRRSQPQHLRDVPVDASCACGTCIRYSREQLRRLYREDVSEAGRLVAIHNLHFYHGLLDGARKAIRENRFAEYKRQFLADYALGTAETV